MRKLLIIALLLFSVSLQGQIRSGVVAASGGVVAADFQNLFLWSEELNRNDDPWVIQSTAVAITATNSANDCDGNATLETLTVTSGNYSSRLRQDIILEESTEYEISFDYKRGTYNQAQIHIYHGGGDNVANSYYSEGNATTPTRITRTFTTAVGQTTTYCAIFECGDGDGTLFLGRVQIRKTSHAEGYIKTEGSPVL